MYEHTEKDCPEKRKYGGGKCDAEYFCEACDKYIINDDGYCTGCRLNFMEECSKNALAKDAKSGETVTASLCRQRCAKNSCPLHGRCAPAQIVIVSLP